MIVQFVNRQSKYPVQTWKRLLNSVITTAWNSSALGQKLTTSGSEPSLTVIFAGPRQMRQINNETRRVDRLTDVLSYPLLDMTEGKLNLPLGAQDYELDKSGRQILPIGDIIISLDKAQAQAEDYGHSMEREVAFLAVHGFLHLLGFDHETIPQEKKMLQKQRQILDSLGLSRE